MGNKIARTTQASASEYYLHDLPSSYNLVLKEVLGSGRFFKSIQCKHDEGLVLVKVYFKRGDSIDLREYERRLSKIRNIFCSLDYPHERRHVWPFQFWLETDKAAYLLRQYFFNNLHDRLGTRPFLSLVEKRWLAFQLLYAVKQSHENGICHGDIKCENVLITSWNWLYLADFASFKPTYIPHDDPSDFSFFFDTGGRRRCYLAPERFYEHGGEMQAAQDAPLKPSMDIFSVGCVVAELFLEGQPLFELSQLLAYRRGQYDPSQLLEKIRDSGIRKMILHMIQLDPDSRLSAESYLQNYASVVFPSYFSPFLHNFYSCLNPLDADTMVVFCQSAFPEIHKQMMSSKSSEDIKYTTTVSDKLSQPVDVKQTLELTQGLIRKKEELERGVIHDRFKLLGDINTLLSDVHHNNHEKLPENRKNCDLRPPGGNMSNTFNRNGHAFLKRITMTDLKSLMSEYDSQSDSFGMPHLPLPRENNSCEGMVLIASMLCSCLRNVKLPHLRRGAILLLKSSALYINDEDRLQRVIPYIIAMLSDSAAIVRCAALEALCDILALVRDFPPSDSKIFPEYILPMLSMLPDDPEESVRICYASSISKLALTAYGFLIHSLSPGEAGVLDKTSLHKKPMPAPELNNNAQLAQLRKSVADIVQELEMGPKQTPNIRRALLQDICYLCCFFGQRQCNDFLLPILPAFLNDRDESLRVVFYGQIVHVCFFVGERSVEEYLLPYIEQALSDVTEAVIVNGLNCLAVLCRSGFLRKRVLLELIGHAFPLLCYPSQWVRSSAVAFIAASSDCLGPIDSYVYLAPVIGPFLCRQPSSLASEKALLDCLKPPAPRDVFYKFLDNARCSDMLGRQRKIWHHKEMNGMSELDSLKNWSDKRHDLRIQKTMGDALCQLDLKDYDSSEVKPSGNPSSTVNVHDPPWSDKLQFSNGCIGGDKSSEGIPLYSFSINKRTAGTVPSESDTSLRLNSIGIASSSMPWTDPKNKQFSLASSVPAPKFVSGSFSFTNGSKQFYRVVHEPDGRDNDQTDGSSVTAEDASPQNDEMGLPSFARTAPMPDSGWRPRGVLVAHLQEHRSAVNDVTVSSDHCFFSSASDDSTVKVWDARRLEKDISFRSRLTYSLEGSRALCTAMFQGSTQVAVGACDGIIHLFSVDCISRGITDIKRRDYGHGAILSLLNYCSDGCATQMVMYSTKNCGVHLWDTRTNSNAWSLKAIPEAGYVLSMVAGTCGNWFVSGSSRGVLTLWDLRFLVPVNSWKNSVACPIEKLCLFVPPPSAYLSTALRPLVYVAAGRNEISLWNAENWSCHQVFRLPNNDNEVETSDLPWALGRPLGKTNLKTVPRRNGNLKYRVEELNEPPSRLPGVRTLLPLPGGDLLSGGTDLKIRRWDHSSPDKSYCVCGPSLKGVGNDDLYETRSSFGVQVVQETKRRPARPKLTGKAVVAAAATDSAGCHRDSILALASAKLNQRLLISSSRDGAIKVWK